MNRDEAVTIGEVDRKVDRVEAKIDGLVEDMARLKITNASRAGQLQGGIGVLVFLGSILGVIAGWFAKAHT